jgi:uncharacterized membrane protein YedE/YeeE
MAENGNERPIPLKVREDKVGMMPWMIALILLFSSLLLFIGGIFYHHANVWVGLFPGIILGMMLEMWNFADPDVIIKAVAWRDRLLLICFGLVVGIGIFLLYFVNMFGIHLNWGFKDLYFWGIIIGGIFFGIGTAIAGYFPGTIWISLGQGRREGWWALGGGLLGALLWSLIYGPLSGALVKAANYGPVSIALAIANGNAIGAWFVGILFAAAFIGMWFFIPRFPQGTKGCGWHFLGKTDPNEQLHSPWTTEYEQRYPKMRKWVMPVAEASTVEASRIVFILALAFAITTSAVIMLRQIFGESTTFSWLGGLFIYAFWPKAIPNLPYLANLLPIHNGTLDLLGKIGWEPISDIGTFLGGLISSVLLTRRWMGYKKDIPPVWKKRFGSSQSKRNWAAFGGAFMVLFGARMAGGCASGHILSGSSQLAASGLLFGAVVLLTAYITAHALYGKALD